MRIFLAFLKWTGIALGLFVAIFIGINLFDDQLDPGAAAILNAPPKVKPGENAYFYWAGAYTAPSENPLEVGQKCVTAQFKGAQSGAAPSDLQSIPECREQNILRPVEDQSITCEWRKKPCLKQYFEQRATIDRLAAQNQMVMERYEQLLAFKQFEDAYYFHPSTGLPQTPPHKLYQAMSASRLQDGDTAAFIHRTAADTAFYRMVLRGETSLLYKMIGASWLERSARLVSDAVQADPLFAQQNYIELLEITRPLNALERSLEKTLEGEFRFSAATLRIVLAENASFFTRLLYRLAFQHNATTNYLYRDMMVWRDLSKVPSEQFLAAEKLVLKRLRKPWRGEYFKLLHNPMGKILVSLGSPNFAGYQSRMIDVDGLLRLISLQIQIAAQKVPESEISNFLQNADPQFRDPYTGLPMQWDKTRGLHFRGHGKSIPDQDGFILVKL